MKNYGDWKFSLDSCRFELKIIKKLDGQEERSRYLLVIALRELLLVTTIWSSYSCVKWRCYKMEKTQLQSR